MQNSGSPQLDLSGKLIIKVALGDDIRRIPIHNEDITYDELVLMMQRVYRGKLSTNDEITIKYKDEDQDLITIFDSSDLTFAIQCSRILKITLFVGGSTKSMLEPASVAALRRELQDIRDRVIDLLDRLEPTSLVSASQSLGIGDGIAGKCPIPAARPMNALGGKEFDPLTAHKGQEDTTHNKVASSFGIDGNVNTASQYERAATPDSVSSIGSSASNQVRAQQNSYQHQSNPANQQQPQTHQQQPQQQQQQLPYGGQPGYNQSQPSPLPQSYAGQPGYGVPQPVLPQQPQIPQQQQQQQQPQIPAQQQQYDPALYNQYAAGYPAAAGQPGQVIPGQGQGQMMYSQAGSPVTGPYNQAPGMPQQPQAKNPGYPTAPAAGPGGAQNNPYSRGGYSAGYPRPNAGYPQ